MRHYDHSRTTDLIMALIRGKLANQLLHLLAGQVEMDFVLVQLEPQVLEGGPQVGRVHGAASPLAMRLIFDSVNVDEQ